MAADVVLADADLSRRLVEIAPPKREQLALAKAGHRGNEVEGPIGRCAGAILCRRASQQGFELVMVEEVDVGTVIEPG